MLIKHKSEGVLFGIPAQFSEVTTYTKYKGSKEIPGIIRAQTANVSRIFDGGAFKLIVNLRFDDSCGNGYENFAITGEAHKRLHGGGWSDMAYGCLHRYIEEVFPELTHLIKWHLTGIRGPMHYIENTVYLAGDRDYNGLRKGEKKQLRNGRTGELAWVLDGPGRMYKDGNERPTETITFEWEPWMLVGVGKDRELDKARATAVWPDATDEELMVDKEELEKRLKERLPQLIKDFEADMRAVGFIYPDWDR